MNAFNLKNIAFLDSHLLKVLLFLNLAVISLSSHGQSTYLLSKADYPKPISPSPEAAALGKFGQTPVSLYSGLNPTSISIYNFKNGDISLPITVDYNSGGIRVDDISTNIGLGWSMNAGGLITRTILGIPDGINDAIFPEDNFDPNSQTLDPTMGVNDDYVNAQRLIQENRDLERDIYYFNFLSYSGKFMISRTGKVVFFPGNPNIKVQNTGTSFIVTDDKGIKYHFTATEGFHNQSVCTVGIQQPNPYHDDGVTAFYLTKIVSPNNYQVNIEYQNWNYTVAKSFNETEFVKSQTTECNDLNQNKKCKTIQTFYGLRISRIYSSDNKGEVKFNYAASNRLDLKYNDQNQGNAIESVNIKYNGAPLKTWNFYHEYFGSGSNLRLKLTRIKEDSGNPYEFYYNEGIALPERLSLSQDHWGFYNGKINTTMIPPVPSIGRYTGADRNPDFNYMIAGSLKRVKYPTGGYSDFEYEPHLVNVNQSSTSYIEETASLSNVSNGILDFYLPPNASELRLTWNLPKINPDDFMTGYIMGGPNFTTVYKTVVNSGWSTIPLSGGMIAGANYRLSIASSNSNDRGDIFLSWKRPVTSNETGGKIVFGGLRIKSIKSYDSGNQIAGNKFYSYSKAFYPLKNYEGIYGTLIGGSSCFYYILANGSLPDLGAVFTNEIGYGEVIETDHPTGLNGRVIYKYLGPITEGAQGNLLEKLEQKFNSSSSSFINVHKLKNEYNVRTAGRDVIYNMVLSYTSHERQTPGLPIQTIPATFEVQKYAMTSARLELIRSEDINYTFDAADSVVNYKKYVYGSSSHNYPTVVEEKNSQGKDISTQNKYVLDVSSTGNATQLMATANIISPLIEKKVYEKATNKELNYVKTNFSDWGNGILKPSSIDASLFGNTPRTEIAFTQYDNMGNLLEFNSLIGSKTSYRWGYNKQYPVVEIKNAGREEFYFQDFEEAGTDFDGGLVRTAARKYTGLYAGILKNTGSEEVVSHSSQYVNVVPGTARMFSFSGWIYSDKPSAQLFLFMYRAGETGYFTYVSDVQTTQIGKWVYVTKDVLVPADVIKMRMRVDNNALGNVYFDDLRIRPTESDMSTFTYKPLIGLGSKTDNKGSTTFYDYDEFMRLKEVKNQNNQIIQSNSYHFKN